MTTQLRLYNGALLKHLGERKLASLSEDRPPRHHLDTVWNDGFVDYVLEQGQWNFAIRTVQATATGDDPAFGYSHAFEKPSDFIRLVGMSADEKFTMPLTDYEEAAGYWYCEHEVIYIKYVSNDESFGGDLASWPESVAQFAQAKLAEWTCESITQSGTKKQSIQKVAAKMLTDARSKDAMNEGVKFFPQGAWVSSRVGNGIHRGRGYRRA